MYGIYQHGLFKKNFRIWKMYRGRMCTYSMWIFIMIESSDKVDDLSGSLPQIKGNLQA